MKTAIAPGKIIITGEHSVLYGAPAMAMAVNRYAKATAASHHESLISFNLLNLKYHKEMTKKALKEVKHRLNLSYESFKRGEINIREVLKLPFELSHHALGQFLENFHHANEDGLKLTTESDIPLGCGMGSSAAMILAVLHAVSLYQGKTVSKEDYFQHALETENLQHGTSSGLDIRISLYGGCVLIENTGYQTITPPSLPITLINTGHPSTSTGECVEHVKPFFKNDILIQRFSEVSGSMVEAMKKNNIELLKLAVKENHRLLVEIGVVPEKVQSFIASLEQANCAAKICGAGGIAGENAGIMMLVGEHIPYELCRQFNYHPFQVQADLEGLRSD